MLAEVAGELGAHAAGAAPRGRMTPLRLGALAALVAAVAGAAIGGTLALRTKHPVVARTAPPITSIASWPAGARPAPGFRLVDQHGVPFTLRSLRGRPVIVTFIDPLCRSLCPLEARVLMQAVKRLPPRARPAIVSVSVNPWGNTHSAFREDAEHWQLDSRWRWGIADRRTLRRVWRAYGIGVQFVTTKVGGVVVHEVEHTEASYVLDATGHERALFLYPFRATDVAATLRRIA
jgi:cytochrome oxidase Cu insertion factor (SCO1/SenC/PrrC family)